MFRRQLVVLAALVAIAGAQAPRASAQGTTNVTLAWTAPGDDGNTGTATQYEVRLSPSPIDAANFGSATLVANPPAPLAAGTAQSMFVGGLQTLTQYWIAIRTADERGNWSAISNVVGFTTSAGDTIRPEAPVLAVGATTASSVTLSWTATGDDSLTGPAHHYEIRWSVSPITAANFAAATLVTAGVPGPGAPGAAQGCTVNGLNRSVDLYFAMRVHDESGNGSEMSNVPRVDRLLDTAPPATPSGLAAGVEPNGVRVRWNANTEPDLAGYHVYRAATSSGPFNRIDGATVTGVEFVDTSAPDSASLWYAVSAVDATGNESARSGALQVWLTADGIASLNLQPGYPNPSPLAGSVTLPIDVPASGPFSGRLDILNAAGERVRTIELAYLTPGTVEVAWDGRSDGGRTCAPGVYRAWLQAGGVSQQVKLVRTP
jgi:FlgD Ig-like domain